MGLRLPWILLAVSVVANVFFAAGVGYTRYSADEDSIVERVTKQLDLTAAQQQGLLALREAVAKRRETVSAPGGGLREAMLAEIGKPTFDRERVAALVADWSEQRRTYFVDVAQDLHGYMATLTPAQREKFLVLARDRHFLRELLRGDR
jgi:Spy/CpxP family protein refolding chaperone